MKRWITVLMCAMLLGMGLVAMADEVSGDGTAADAPASSVFGGGWQSMLILFAVFGAIFYFMLIRPQRKRQAKMTELMTGLKRGDNVITAGGIYGEIDSIGDTAVVIVLEDGAKLKVAKSSVIQKKDK
ncbi:preprotein translocase subunit YajC [Candidatus Bipolaricaulota bacterium]|jgi:preprotein translocase subunit YajC|nr:preprotein translocase subunit YajC [Candidatus Bipolaricaulota bacterium]TFH09378.1 MAG: preprotein translocase subunit YajC [Candidatus Atribacteria bacterium]